nr:protein F20H11.4 [imported] - Caenorhabditis elegans [Caenorhabditis elegans]
MSRYYDILCPDATRVVLQNRPPDNDFIHANWMTMPDKFRYISAQGPMDQTVEDFWHMVYTEKAPAVVMICDWEEDGIQKCSRYIPSEDNISHVCGIYRITKIDQMTMVYADVALQSFEISVTDKSLECPSLVVKHYHFLKWRDHTAPMTSISVLKLLKALRDPKRPGPPVIHCSAGIGRTATLIGVDYGNQRIGEVGEMNVLDIVREMRQMRDKAVQSHHQFIFMLMCIADRMVLDGVPQNDNMLDLADFYTEFMKKVLMERKKKDEAEKAKKEKEEKRKRDEANDKTNEKSALSKTQSVLQ